MNDMSTIQAAVAEQVAIRTEELLIEARPKIADAIRSQFLDGLDKLVEERVEAQLEEMRPIAERNARAEVLQSLTGYNGTDVEPVVEIATPTPLSPAMVNNILSQALDPITASRGIKKAGKKWACAFCDMKFQTPRAATMHSRKCDKRAEILQQATAPANAVTVTVKKKRQRGVVETTPKRTCIKPNCVNPSKGPRFHHLCGDHQNAPARHVRAWQRKVREARAE